MSWGFEDKKILVEYNFIREDILLNLDDNTFKEFYNDFHNYFFSKKLPMNLYNYLCEICKNISIEENKKNQVKNALSRTFQQKNDDDLKGLIGEHLLPFYHKDKSLLYEYGPKSNSSKEPGIDYIVFLKEYDNIIFIVWEIKTTENEVSTRVSEINNFFSLNGSFDENIYSSIKEIQNNNINSSNQEFKDFINCMDKYILENSFCFKIGGCVISCQNNLTKDTFKSFASVRPSLVKEQRIVKIIIFEMFHKLIQELKDKVWNKL